MMDDISLAIDALDIAEHPWLADLVYGICDFGAEFEDMEEEPDLEGDDDDDEHSEQVAE